MNRDWRFVLVALFLAGCAAQTPASPGAPSSPTASAPATPSVPATASAPSTSSPLTPSPAPPTPTPTAAYPTPTGAPPSPVETAGSPSAAPSPGAYSPDEQMLFDIASLYIEANVDGSGAAVCEPKRLSLPAGATAGIECVGDYGAALAGYYLFPSAAVARQTYEARMAQFGVTLDSGDCAAGIPGDSAWWVPAGVESSESPWRIGCFWSATGRDNLRLVCHAGTAGSPSPVLYIGLVGYGNSDYPSESGLVDFALGDAEYRQLAQVGDPPQICSPHGYAD